MSDFTKFSMPIIRATFPKLVISDLVGVQPLGILLAPCDVYLVRENDGVWETCTQKDLYDPDYVPYFGTILKNKDSYAVWDADLKPIICTDRDIFKHVNVKPEIAKITSRRIPLANPSFKSEIFFLNYKAETLVNPKDGYMNVKKPE